MKKRDWKSQEKLQIVLAGLSGKMTISELCNLHEISQSQYYKWRDQLLKNSDQLFTSNSDKQVERLNRENRRLKTVIGDLTVELKKTEDELSWLES